MRFTAREEKFLRGQPSHTKMCTFPKIGVTAGPAVLSASTVSHTRLLYRLSGPKSLQSFKNLIRRGSAQSVARTGRTYEECFEEKNTERERESTSFRGRRLTGSDDCVRYRQCVWERYRVKERERNREKMWDFGLGRPNIITRLQPCNNIILVYNMIIWNNVCSSSSSSAARVWEEAKVPVAQRRTSASQHGTVRT